MCGSSVERPSRPSSAWRRNPLRLKASVKQTAEIRRPVLARHARYRWDALRQQHQIVFPEGMLVLNETGAAIVQRCDGRPTDDLIAAVMGQFAEDDPAAVYSAGPAAEVRAFLGRLSQRGLLRDMADS